MARRVRLPDYRESVQEASSQDIYQNLPPPPPKKGKTITMLVISMTQFVGDCFFKETWDLHFLKYPPKKEEYNKIHFAVSQK